MTQQHEEELRRLLGAPPGVPEARLHRVREVVFARIAQADAPRRLRLLAPAWHRFRPSLKAPTASS